MVAKMARFYGWSHEEILGISYNTFLMYYNAITVIEAQDNLVKMNLADYPNMKKEGRSNFYRQMRKNAYPVGLQKTIEFDDFVKRMTDGK